MQAINRFSWWWRRDDSICESPRHTKLNRRRLSIYKRVYPSTLSVRIFPNVMQFFANLRNRSKGPRRGHPKPADSIAINTNWGESTPGKAAFPRFSSAEATQTWPPAKYEVVSLLGANFAVTEFGQAARCFSVEPPLPVGSAPH